MGGRKFQTMKVKAVYGAVRSDGVVNIFEIGRAHV